MVLWFFSSSCGSFVPVVLGFVWFSSSRGACGSLAVYLSGGHGLVSSFFGCLVVGLFRSLLAWFCGSVVLCRFSSSLVFRFGWFCGSVVLALVVLVVLCFLWFSGSCCFLALVVFMFL